MKISLSLILTKQGPTSPTTHRIFAGNDHNSLVSLRSFGQSPQRLIHRSLTTKNSQTYNDSHRKLPWTSTKTTGTTTEHHRECLEPIWHTIEVPKTPQDTKLHHQKQTKSNFFSLFFSCRRIFPVTKNNSFRSSSRHYLCGLISPHRRCCH